MKTRQMFVSHSIRIALVAGLATTGFMACSNPADDVPAAAVAEPVESEPTTEGTGDTKIFTLADETTVSFVGSKITGSHDGGFEVLTGEIEMVDGDPTLSSLRMTIDTTTLWTDTEKLTGHLKSADFFDVENHPTATFTSTKIAAAAEGYSITGNLDLHGISKSITFPAAIQVSPEGVKAQAEFSVMRFDFNIVYPGRKDDLIRDEVVVKFDLVAAPMGEQDA
jgi:polyisoprenoid-binding protein YceI